MNRFFVGVRFKILFPNYETFIAKTNLTMIEENLFNTVLGVYGNHQFSKLSEEEILGFVKWNFSNSYKIYSIILNISNLPYKDLIAQISLTKGANFNAKNIILSEFNENDNSFLEQFAKQIQEIGEQPLSIMKKIIENYTTAENEFLQMIRPSFAASRDIQIIDYEVI